MLIFKDVVTGKEMFTDAFQLKEEGPFVSFIVRKMRVKGGIDERMIGGNASAEGGGDDEQVEDGEVEVFQCKEYGVDDCPWDFSSQKELKNYMKEFLKNHVKSVKSKKECCSDTFEKQILEDKFCFWKEKIKDVLELFVSKYNPDEDSIYSHQDFNFEDKDMPVFIGKWLGDDGRELELTTIKACFLEEKC